jgi:hypothetical protein
MVVFYDWGCLLTNGGFMHHNEEARYHFILMDMVDLIGDYGYQRVMEDLEVAISDKVNRLVQRAVAEDAEE